jgi:hypothetical protein
MDKSDSKFSAMGNRAGNPPRSEDMTLKDTAFAYRADVPDGVYRLRTPEDRGWEEFRDQCRRQMLRPMELRIKYGFCRRIKPVPDATPWRAFDTMAEYRAWCEANLPDYLGFKRPSQ